MEKYYKIAWVPLSTISVMGIIHNGYLAKARADLHTGSPVIDWGLAFMFAIGIETALWTLMLHRKELAVKGYTVVLWCLNMLFYLRGSAPEKIFNLFEPGAWALSETWMYFFDLVLAVIFSTLLSGFLWYLSEVLMEQMRSRFGEEAATGTHEPAPITVSAEAATLPLPASFVTAPVEASSVREPAPDAPKEAALPLATESETAFSPVSASKPVSANNEFSVTAASTTASPEADKWVQETTPDIPILKEKYNTIQPVPVMRVEKAPSHPLRLDTRTGKRCLQCSEALQNKREDAKFCDKTCKQRYYRKQEKVSA